MSVVFDICRLFGTILAKRPRYAEKISQMGPITPIPIVIIPIMGFSSALQCVAGCSSSRHKFKHCATLVEVLVKRCTYVEYFYCHLHIYLFPQFRRIHPAISCRQERKWSGLFPLLLLRKRRGRFALRMSPCRRRCCLSVHSTSFPDFLLALPATPATPSPRMCAFLFVWPH